MTTTRTKIAAAERTLRVLRAKQKRIDRRDDTRRKILYGIAVLKLLDTMSNHERARLLASIESHVVRPTDRDFLGLPALPHQEPAKATTAGDGEKPSARTVLQGPAREPAPDKVLTTVQPPLPLFQ